MMRRSFATAVVPIMLASGLAYGAGGVSVSVRDARGTAVPGAVVYLEGGAATSAPATEPVVVDQRDKEFVPAVTVIQAGTEVVFSNSDTVSHHVYSFAQPNAFELPLFKGLLRPRIQFDHAGIVTLGCNIHDAMVGYIVVVDTPYFAVTDDNGIAEFHSVPAGEYQTNVWSARLDPRRPLKVGPVTVGGSSRLQSVAATKRLRATPQSEGSLAAGDY